MKKLLTHIFNRVVLVALFIVLQVAAVLFVFTRFMRQFPMFYLACMILALFLVLKIISQKGNPENKLAWIIPIIALPIFGALLYLMFGKYRMTKREKKKLHEILDKNVEAMSLDKHCRETLKDTVPDAYLQSSYIHHMSLAPLHTNTQTEFFAEGMEMYESMLDSLKKAKHFIFMEYFIVDFGTMWFSILEILEEKVNEGVDVRFMYDDLGCIFTLPSNYCRQLESKGIKCCAVNRFIPVISSRFNNRDHRKICVIDGYIGYTGGINLADEYINVIDRYGHWKDTGIVMKGYAVWNLTVMFLSFWDYYRTEKSDFKLYHPNCCCTESFTSDGFVQPFTDTPIDDEAVGENVYLNMINRAKKYVYISTPYLVIDSTMLLSLTTASKSGVDVRIVLPGLSDNYFTQELGRSDYRKLVEAGVKVYEYTPGFIHSKVFLCDDKYAIVGTINLDFRSLYLHYECGVWMYDCSCTRKIYDDYMHIFNESEEITLSKCLNTPLPKRFVRALLKLIAPLM